MSGDVLLVFTARGDGRAGHCACAGERPGVLVHTRAAVRKIALPHNTG